MLCQVRWVVLAVFLALIVFAGSASAECAWALWEGVWTEKGTPHDQSWSLIAAWAANKDCQSTLARAVADRAQRWRGLPTQTVTVEGNQVSVTSSAGFINYTYVCFPDTMDPRGPKAR